MQKLLTKKKEESRKLTTKKKESKKTPVSEIYGRNVVLQLNLINSVLFFNRCSGAVALVEKKWFNALEEKDREKILEKNNFRLTSEQECDNWEKIVKSLNRYRKNRGLNFYISPHFDCPMGCGYCFQQEAKERNERLKPHHIEKVLDFVAGEQKRQKIKKVVIVMFGGEPLLPSAYKLNEQIMHSAKERGYKVRIVTSGSTLDSKYLALFEQYREVISDIDITLDGPEEIHNRLRPLKSGANSYQIIKKNMDTLIKNKFPVSAKVNVGKDNIEHLGEFFEFFAEYGWTKFPKFKILINFVKNFGGLEDQDQTLSESSAIIKLSSQIAKTSNEVKNKIQVDGVKLLNYLAHCFLSRKLFSGEPRAAYCNPDSRTTYSIGPDCNIYSCNWMVGKKDFVETNILQEKAIEVKKNPDQCIKCVISTLCGGGCMIERSQKDFFENCRKNNLKMIADFVERAAPQLKTTKFIIINEEFKW